MSPRWWAPTQFWVVMAAVAAVYVITDSWWIAYGVGIPIFGALWWVEVASNKAGTTVDMEPGTIWEIGYQTLVVTLIAVAVGVALDNWRFGAFAAASTGAMWWVLNAATGQSRTPHRE
jgi:hypothetical protein